MSDPTTPSSDGGATTPQSADAPPSDKTPEQLIAQLEADNKQVTDRLLRLAAEFDNWKKRAKKEIEDAAPRAREALAKELLGSLDNLSRALSHAKSDDPLAVGVRMVEKQILSALEKFQITRFPSEGQPFDPALHEAIQQVETADVPAGTVFQELAAGYMSGPRLLRAAMVVVAKAPAAADAAPAGESN